MFGLSELTLRSLDRGSRLCHLAARVFLHQFSDEIRHGLLPPLLAGMGIRGRADHSPLRKRRSTSHADRRAPWASLEAQPQCIKRHRSLSAESGEPSTAVCDEPMLLPAGARYKAAHSSNRKLILVHKSQPLACLTFPFSKGHKVSGRHRADGCRHPGGDSREVYRVNVDDLPVATRLDRAAE